MEENGRKVPALGLCWANTLTTRLMLSRTEHYVTVALRDNQAASTQQCDSKAASTQQCNSSVTARTYQANVRNLEVLFAPYLPNSVCRFIVDEDGVKGLPGESVD